MRAMKAHRILRILFSILLAVFVVYIRIHFSPILGYNKNTYIIFYPAVMLFALFSGFIGGATATIIFAISALYLLLPPYYTFTSHNRYDIIGFIIFSVTGLFISIICEILQKTRRKAEKQTYSLTRTTADLREAKEQLQTILANVADGIIVRNEKGDTIYANDAATKLFKLSPRNGKHQYKIDEYSKHYDILNEQGQPISLSEIPGSKVLAGAKQAEATICFKKKTNKEEFWHIARAKGIFDRRRKLQFVVVVLTDITARKKIDRQKDEFISIASHELKTPVTSLKAYTQVLEKRFEKAGDTNSVHQLAKMDAQIDKLTNLIHDLLDVTKIQEGQLQFNKSAFAIDALIIETVEEVQRTTQKHRIIVKGRTKNHVFADRERISQVIVNLLTNAIKYSPHAETVIVETAVNPSHVTVCVRDFGIGIAKEKQSNLFQRFFRVAGSKQETYPGLGLGLYISSEIIKREGGKIWVESVEGKGATFCFTLPIKK